MLYQQYGIMFIKFQMFIYVNIQIFHNIGSSDGLWGKTVDLVIFDLANL